MCSKEIKEEQKIEAIKRLKAFGLMENVIEEFEKKDIVYYSERMRFATVSKPFGILYFLSNEKKWETIVKNWEQETGNLVYHITHELTNIGEMLTLLYVSRHKEEWDMDLEDIGNNEALAYCVNMTYEIDSEYGIVFVKESGGGLVRIL